MFKEHVGYLKLAQRFRENVEHQRYFPILEHLESVALKHHDSLPSSFSISNLENLDVNDVEFVLSKLYPSKKFSCTKVGAAIFCINS